MDKRSAVLSAAQQASLDVKKVRARKARPSLWSGNHGHGTQVELAASDEKYLRAHPEVAKMVSQFMDHCVRTRPASVREAGVAFFSDPEKVRSMIA
jgi:hypothetical protein